jgi:hypothetical protein
VIVEFPGSRAERDQIAKLKAEIAAATYTHVLLENLTLGELLTALRFSGIGARLPHEGSPDVVPVLFRINPKGAA